MNRNLMRIAGGACAMLMCAGASAREAGDWMLRLGFHYVDPKNDNHETVQVEGAGAVTAAATWFMTPTLAVDLLAAMPFEHDVELKTDGSKVGSAQHLPPTLSLVWFPELSRRFKPFVGAGLNYTTFFEEKTRGALDGVRLRLDDSFGLALMAGVEYQFANDFSLIADVRHFDIDTEAHLNGDSAGKVHIDPWAYGLAVAYRF